MTDLNRKLEEFGLTINEIKVYLFLLSNRDITVYKIATGVLIPRTTVYKILVSLENQGLVSQWLKNGVKYFSAESPERLSFIINKKKEITEQIMPDLLNLFHTESIYPTAKLYFGKEGVKQVFDSILEKSKREKIKRLYVYTDDLLTAQLPKFFEDWRQKKNKIDIFTQLIVPSNTPMNKSYASNELRETRVLPAEFSFAGSFDICGSLVALFSFKDNEVYSIVIDSPTVSDMLTKMFQYIWMTLEK